jgi:hypothetical protein
MLADIAFFSEDVILKPAGGFASVHAAIDKIRQSDNGNQSSDHDPPPLPLTRNIDSQVTTQVLVGVLAIEITFTCVHVAFTVVFPVVLSSIFTHDVTSVLFWGSCFLLIT